MYTIDGNPGNLSYYWGNSSGTKNGVATAKWTLGWEQSAKLVCGTLVRDGRVIETGICVTVA
ncbi:hypothetical protein SUDANB178_07450 [Streptomyces sp. enrichment culture]